MTLLFLIALILAIPTYGLSILAWVVWFFLAARKNARDRFTDMANMRATRSVVEPLVGGTRSEFYQALDIPKNTPKRYSIGDPYVLQELEGKGETRESECGQHILNFISHNPDITNAFMEALKFHRLKGSASLPTAIEAIELERDQEGGPMHHICYFSIATITSQNNLRCFDNINIESMEKKMLQIVRDFPGTIDYAY